MLTSPKTGALSQQVLLFKRTRHLVSKLILLSLFIQKARLRAGSNTNKILINLKKAHNSIYSLRNCKRYCMYFSYSKWSNKEIEKLIFKFLNDVWKRLELLKFIGKLSKVETGGGHIELLKKLICIIRKNTFGSGGVYIKSTYFSF